MPDIEIKGWKFSLFDVYTQKIGVVRAVSTTFKVIGGALGMVGMVMTYAEIQNGNKNWFGEGGLDMAMGVAGFFWPYGTIISAIYFTGGKYIWNKYGDNIINYFH